MSKREISETSKNIYSKNIIRLNDGEPVKNYNFLKKNEIIMSKINHLKPNSQRTYLISIVSTLKGLKGFDKEFKYYYDKMMKPALRGVRHRIIYTSINCNTSVWTGDFLVIIREKSLNCHSL